jgi:hypothetical protein
MVIGDLSCFVCHDDEDIQYTLYFSASINKTAVLHLPNGGRERREKRLSKKKYSNSKI